jgi:fucose permease
MTSTQVKLTERSRLFNASCVGLVATAMTFGIRADILGQLVTQFHLTNEEVGWIAGTAFWGFTLSMFLGGPASDWLGMKRVIQIAFVTHLLGIGVTIAAHSYAALFVGTMAIGMGNGFYESAVNPLTATLYRDSKTERLNRMHVWFPGGIVIGCLVALTVRHMGFGWRAEMTTILLPVLAYGLFFFRAQLPPTERQESGVSASVMYRQALRPGFLLLLFCILLTAATELGPNQWIPSLLTNTLHLSGVVVLIWITGLMAIGRRFAGTIVHRISPTVLLMLSAVLAAVGLLGLGSSASTIAVFMAATIYALGVCYFWPTMYGITAERFPAGGAFLLSLIGGMGMLSDALVIPLIGRMYDRIGALATLRYVALLPCAVLLIFLLIWLYDRRSGGYKIVHLDAFHPGDKTATGLSESA